MTQIAADGSHQSAVICASISGDLRLKFLSPPVLPVCYNAPMSSRVAQFCPGMPAAYCRVYETAIDLQGVVEALLATEISQSEISQYGKTTEVKPGQSRSQGGRTGGSESRVRPNKIPHPWVGDFIGTNSAFRTSGPSPLAP